MRKFSPLLFWIVAACVWLLPSGVYAQPGPPPPPTSVPVDPLAWVLLTGGAIALYNHHKSKNKK